MRNMKYDRIGQFLAPAAFAAGVIVAQPALALDAGWYGQVMAGATIVNEADLSAGGPLTFDLGYDIAGAIGFKTTVGLRLELEGAWRSADNDKMAGVADNGDLSSLSVMTNLAYDFNMGGAVQPYLGVGIGLASLDAKMGGVKSDDTVFAYQGFAGVAYQVSKTFDLFGQYRYFATSNPTFGAVEGEMATHNFEIGTRFHF